MKRYTLPPFCLLVPTRLRTCSRSSKQAPPNPHSGMILLVVLFWLTLAQTTALYSLHHSTLYIRSLRAHYHALQARHAAYAGNVLCAQLLENDAITVHAWNKTTAPAYWRTPGVFDKYAAFVAHSWPGSIRAPLCLVERWTVPGAPLSSFYLITTKGFGPLAHTVAWKQEMRWTEKENREGEKTDEAKWHRAQRPLLTP